MNTLSSHRHRVPPDDLDALLRDYFRAEMPKAWPAAPVPAPTLRLQPAPRAFLGARGRSLLALAAGVALLVGGLWQIGGAPETAGTPPGINTDGSHADRGGHKAVIDEQIKHEKPSELPSKR